MKVINMEFTKHIIVMAEQGAESLALTTIQI